MGYKMIWGDMGGYMGILKHMRGYSWIWGIWGDMARYCDILLIFKNMGRYGGICVYMK
jgi:hypothetical protein